MTIKLVTFDLDNTLWDVDTIIRQAERDMVNWLRDNVPESLEHYHPEQLAVLRERVAGQFPDKIHDLSHMRREVLFEVMRLAGLDRTDARRQSHGAFDVFFEGRNSVSFFPGALDTLEALAGRFTLMALTNGNADISKAGLSQFFAGAVSSADVGAKKPDPAMFNVALKQHGVEPRAAVHIGDHLVDDIEGALNAGMHAIWVNFDKTSREESAALPHKEVHELPHLIGAIEELIPPADL